MNFQVIGEISDIERIARGPSVRERARLRKQFGGGRWRKLKGIASVRLANGRYRPWNCTGMRLMALVKEIENQALFRLRTMKQSRTTRKFVLCIRNEDCEDLEPRKVYLVLPDERAAKDGYIRVIDESGEDYLYPQDYFLPIELPKHAEKALLSAA